MTEDEKIIVAFLRMRSVMHFPGDAETADEVHRYLVERWRKAGSPLSERFDEGLARFALHSTKPRMSHGITSAAMLLKILQMHQRGLDVSLNKASFLAAEDLRDHKFKNRTSIKIITRAEEIRKVFRKYRHVSHYWMLLLRPQRISPPRTFIEQQRHELSYCEQIRFILLQIKGIRAKDWEIDRVSPQVRFRRGACLSFNSPNGYLANELLKYTSKT